MAARPCRRPGPQPQRLLHPARARPAGAPRRRVVPRQGGQRAAAPRWPPVGGGGAPRWPAAAAGRATGTRGDHRAARRVEGRRPGPASAGDRPRLRQRAPARLHPLPRGAAPGPSGRHAPGHHRPARLAFQPRPRHAAGPGGRQRAAGPRRQRARAGVVRRRQGVRLGPALGRTQRAPLPARLARLRCRPHQQCQRHPGGKRSAAEPGRRAPRTQRQSAAGRRPGPSPAG